MSQITRWDAETERQLKLALVQATGSMELATRITEAAIVRMGGIHQDAVQEVTDTLKVTDNLVQAAQYAGMLTPQKQAEVAQHTEKYVNRILQITHDAGQELIDKLLKRK